MQIRLIPPHPHPSILYGVTFPNVLPLHQLGPGATIPAAWSSQLQILTSILNLEPPSSIHMLDRAVGLVARVRSLSMDLPQKEFVVEFIDDREITVPMNSDCVRMLLGVVDDVHGCNELERQRDSMEGSASHGSTAGSTEDVPSGGSPTKPPKLGKHKRQRSLLFSLISSLVPKSLSSPPRSPPPSCAPPPAPLPALSVVGRMTSPPSSPFRATFPSTQPTLLRRRARATLLDVWRRHVIPALAPQHLPAAGYLEWTLIALASATRADIEAVGTVKSHGYATQDTRALGNGHKRTRSEGRNALDFGDRSDDRELEQWRYRAPSPFPDILSTEDIDQVVYPRRDQDEWGVRYVNQPRSPDEADIFMIDYNGHNESLLGEHFTMGDYWEDNEPLALQLGRARCHDVPRVAGRSSCTGDRHVHLDDFPLACDGGGCVRLADTAFDMSTCPLTPSDIVDDEESDDSQTSLRTPEDGEGLPLAPPMQLLQGSTHDTICSAPQSTLVCRANSSRPRSRDRSSQSSVSYPLVPSRIHSIDYRDMHPGEYIASRVDYLERVYSALEVVRSRAREEGWKLVRATLIGAKNEWMDAELEQSLEIKAKRRAWSSGAKISAPYPPLPSTPKVWDGTFSTFGSPVRPPGLNSSSRRAQQGRGPITPTGLSLGIPLRSSPLAMYVWSAEDGKSSTPSKYGALTSMRRIETAESKRPLRVSFADSVTKLFPVCEDESDLTFESAQVNAVGFPQAVPQSVSAEEHECNFMEGIAQNEDDLLYLCSSRPQPRTRTTSMHPSLSACTASSTPVLPILRPSTPPPSYRAAVGGDIPNAANDEEGLDTSALLLQPLSSLSVSSLPQLLSPSQCPPVSSPSCASRPRSVSLPTPKSHLGLNKTRRISFHHKDEHCEDLSQAYASPPPEGPLVISATPAPHEQYPRYAHMHSPIPANKCMNAAILGRAGKEMVFEQAGSEFTVGIEVTLG